MKGLHKATLLALLAYRCPVAWLDLDARFWHLADIGTDFDHVRFRG